MAGCPGISLAGSLTIGGGACVTGCPPQGGDLSAKALSLRCPGGGTYQGAVETAEPIRVTTPGAVGQFFVDLALLAQLTAVELLYVRSDNQIELRIGAATPKILGAGGIFPTLFVGGETLDLLFVDPNVATTVVNVVFGAGDQTPAQVAARINAACALAGLATPRAVVQTTGQLQIDGLGTGTGASVEITAGTGAAQIGLGGTPSAQGAGADVPVWGTFLAEFGIQGTPPGVPARIQVSGNANLSIVAAGRTTG